MIKSFTLCTLLASMLVGVAPDAMGQAGSGKSTKHAATASAKLTKTDGHRKKRTRRMRRHRRPRSIKPGGGSGSLKNR